MYEAHHNWAIARSPFLKEPVDEADGSRVRGLLKGGDSFSSTESSSSSTNLASVMVRSEIALSKKQSGPWLRQSHKDV
jgi:hypothetical protein